MLARDLKSVWLRARTLVRALILKSKHLLKINLETEFLTEFNIYS
jgi:hypothetical protein